MRQRKVLLVLACLMVVGQVAPSYPEETGGEGETAKISIGGKEFQTQYFTYVGAVNDSKAPQPWGVALGAAMMASHPMLAEIQFFPQRDQGRDIQNIETLLGGHYVLKRSERTLLSLAVRGGVGWLIEFGEEANYYARNGYTVQPALSVLHHWFSASDGRKMLIALQGGWKINSWAPKQQFSSMLSLGIVY